MTNLDHLHSLIAHGAQIGYRTRDGLRSYPLDERFYNDQLRSLQLHPAAAAVTFTLVLPGIAEPMAMAIWRDGHIDTGSKDSIARCLGR